jgi:hypothetical protein
VTDPIVRAYKELGRYLLLLRVFLFTAMTAALFYGIQNFDMRGMIVIVVVTALTEKFVFTSVILKKLNVRRNDLVGLKTIGKTAVAGLTAGFFTFLFYWEFAERLFLLGAKLPQAIFAAPKTGIIDFIAGGLVLGVCALIFTPIYLLTANYFGIIEDEDKDKVRSVIGKLTGRNDSQIESRKLKTKDQLLDEPLTTDH